MIEKPVRTAADIAALRTDRASDLGYVAESVAKVVEHFEDDLPVKRKSGEPMPTLVLKEVMHPELFETYDFFLNNHLIAHGRTSFVDTPDSDRLLLRFWLRPQGGVGFEV